MGFNKKLKSVLSLLFFERRRGVQTVQCVLSTCSYLAVNIDFALQTNLFCWSGLGRGVHWSNLLVKDWSRAFSDLLARYWSRNYTGAKREVLASVNQGRSNMNVGQFWPRTWKEGVFGHVGQALAKDVIGKVLVTKWNIGQMLVKKTPDQQVSNVFCRGDSADNCFLFVTPAPSIISVGAVTPS